jgi:hypothetical protein
MDVDKLRALQLESRIYKHFIIKEEIIQGRKKFLLNNNQKFDDIDSLLRYYQVSTQTAV